MEGKTDEEIAHAGIDALEDFILEIGLLVTLRELEGGKIAAWPVDGFIKANDFTGKTVIPFCTSSSSGLGKSGELLKEMAGSGEWLEGKRFRSGASEETVRSWVEDLGL